MIVFDRVFCDCCDTYMGQLWNQPASAPDLLPAPDFRVCDDCHLSAIPQQEREQWLMSA